MPPLPVLQVRPAPSHPFRPQPESADHTSLMGNSALFAGIPPDQCREIAASARSRVFVPDEILFMQGHPVQTHVLIRSGNVKVTQVSDTGSEVLLWMNGPGQTVGIPNEAPGCVHAFSARAMQRCQALTWEHSRFLSLIVKHPQITFNINRMLSLQLNELEQRFSEIATERVALRLSRALLRLVSQIGTPTSGGIELSLSREELAQMIGTTVFTVSRILSKWGDEGFIAPRREAVIVYDLQRLLFAGGHTE